MLAASTGIPEALESGICRTAGKVAYRSGVELAVDLSRKKARAFRIGVRGKYLCSCSLISLYRDPVWVIVGILDPGADENHRFTAESVLIYRKPPGPAWAARPGS